MKMTFKQSNGFRLRLWGLHTVIVITCLLMPTAWNMQAAGKGGGKDPGDKPSRVSWIDVKFTFYDDNDGSQNTLISDGSPYVHDEDFVSAQIGAVENINLVLNTKFRKTPIRHVWLQGDPFAGLAEAAEMVGLTAPSFSSGEVPIGMFQICGENLDELEGTKSLQFRLILDDALGHAWEISYIGKLTRISPILWGFEATAGVLLGFPEGPGPDGPVHVGDVLLPLSGVVESLP